MTRPPIVVHLKAAPPPARPPVEPKAPQVRQETSPKPKVNPVALAHHWLKRRLIEKESGFWLDGNPVSFDDVIRATNRVLKANGREQVGTKETWLV